MDARFIETIDVNRVHRLRQMLQACSRDVLDLIEKTLEGEDEYGDDMGNKVMTVARPENCIGCEACARTCTKTVSGPYRALTRRHTVLRAVRCGHLVAE